MISLVNLSTVYNNPLPVAFDNARYNLITFSRGITYTFSNQIYIVDITNCSPMFPNSSSNIINSIYTKPGRATNCYFTIRNKNYNNFLIPRMISFTLNDPYNIFVINPPSIVLYTSQNSVSFMIGGSCGVLSGTYYIRFNQSDSINFFMIPPIPIYVDGSVSNGIANLSYIGDLPKASQQPFTLNLSDFTIDTLTYNFVGGDGNTNDSTAVMSNVVVKAFTNSVQGIFSISQVTASGNQSFKVPNPNNCWGPNPLTAIFNVNADTVSFPANLILSNYFSNYINSDTDPTLSLAKNSISFSFLPPLSPMYLICNLK